MGIADKLSAPDEWHRRLLRPRRARPRDRRTAEQRDELADASLDHLVGAGEQTAVARLGPSPSGSSS